MSNKWIHVFIPFTLLASLLFFIYYKNPELGTILSCMIIGALIVLPIVLTLEFNGWT